MVRRTQNGPFGEALTDAFDGDEGRARFVVLVGEYLVGMSIADKLDALTDALITYTEEDVQDGDSLEGKPLLPNPWKSDMKVQVIAGFLREAVVSEWFDMEPEDEDEDEVQGEEDA